MPHNAFCNLTILAFYSLQEPLAQESAFSSATTSKIQKYRFSEKNQ
jgi:hypothetical protein